MTETVQTENVIEVRDLTKRYKELTAVDDISFDVRKGEILGLLGPNGSGKSTTINCILSLLSFQSGSIRIFGEEMKPDRYDIKKQIGVIFQEIAVFRELTVRDNIDYFCGLYIPEKSTRAGLVDGAVEFTGLRGYEKFYPKQLSGGLMRRLNIACGIAHKPKLLFADEPTAAIDPQSRNSILQGFETLRQQGATVVYTTHYMEEVEMICDRVIILDKGKIIASGTIDELKDLANVREKISVEIMDLEDGLMEEIRVLPHVIDVKRNGNTLHIAYGAGHNNLAEFMDFLHGHELRYDKVYSERPTLNDVFLELTGKELRD
ncbi:MAG: ATP-binding cassette domain-containing protein [Anaerovoracaceae bacterium]